MKTSLENLPDTLNSDLLSAGQERKLRRKLKRELQNFLQGTVTGRINSDGNTVILQAAALIACPPQERSEDTTVLAVAEQLAAANKTYISALETLKKLDRQSLSKILLSHMGTVKESNYLSAAAFVGNVLECLNNAGKKEANKTIASPDKRTDHEELISFTQILTPPWVVKNILLETLVKGPLQKSADDLKSLRNLKVFDPSMGTGNFLFGALEIFADCYLDHDLSQGEALLASLKNNLHGADIDSAALQVAYLIASALALKSGVAPDNLQDLTADLTKKWQWVGRSKAEDGDLMLGSLMPFPPEDSTLAKNDYDVVVTNPPYLGRKLLDRKLKTRLKELFPGCQNELGHCFLVRALDWCRAGGKIGFITQSSLLSLPSARTVREKLLKNTGLEVVTELGAGVFPLLSGEKADSFILIAGKNTESAEPGSYKEVRYTDLRNVQEKSQVLRSIMDGKISFPFLIRRQEDFASDVNLTFNFKRPRAANLLYAKLKRLGSLAEIKQGLATSNNERFVRYFWEVPPRDIGINWQPYIKGKGTTRWYHPLEHVVLWQNNGQAVKEAVNQAYPYLKGKVQWVVKNEDYYFKPGLTFSFVNASALAVRQMPAGCIFDVGGSAIFPTAIDEYLLLAYLNSGLAITFAQDINPTINYQVGDLKQIPVPDFAGQMKEDLIALCQEAIKTGKTLYHLDAPYMARQNLEDLKITAESYQSYKKTQHLVQEKQIELDGRNDEAVLKAAAIGLTLNENTEILSWMESCWRQEAQKPKSKEEYALAQLVAIIMQLLFFADRPSVVSYDDIAKVLDQEFLREALGQDAQIYLHQKLNEKLKVFFFQQPPFFTISAEGTVYFVPFIEFQNNSLENLPAPLSSKLADLRRQLPAEARARQLFELL